MLKWTACENLPADLDYYEAASTAADTHYVTMLFNDETHTYDQVAIFMSLYTWFSNVSSMHCALCQPEFLHCIMHFGSYTPCSLTNCRST